VIRLPLEFRPPINKDADQSARYAYVYAPGITIQIVRNEGDDGVSMRVRVFDNGGGWSHMETGRGVDDVAARYDAEARIRERCPAAWELYAAAVLRPSEEAVTL
jgi:hypothetical protein